MEKRGCVQSWGDGVEGVNSIGERGVMIRAGLVRTCVLGVGAETLSPGREDTGTGQWGTGTQKFLSTWL